MSDFQDKLQQLPDQVKAYLVSTRATETNVYIYDKYDLEPDKASILTKLIGQVFFKEIKLSELQSKIKQEVGVPQDKIEPLLRDIVGFRFLMIDDWLEEDAEEFLRGLDGDPEEYKQFIKEFKEEVKKEQAKEKVQKDLRSQEKKEEEKGEEKKEEEERSSTRSDKHTNFPQRQLDLEKEKKESLDIFENSLKHLLQSQNTEILEDYNLLLIRLFSDDLEGSFRKDLEKSLLKNQEKITNKKFVLEGEEKEPTISNWLRYFIKQNGTDVFDNMVLSEFLANSDNAKILDTKEKESVRKLLILYKNVKFFFQIFQNKDVEDWFVFPVSPEGKEEAGQGAPEEKDRDNREEDNSSPVQSSFNKQLEELKKQKEQYPEDSLERRAVEEEIKKIKNS